MYVPTEMTNQLACFKEKEMKNTFCDRICPPRFDLEYSLSLTSDLIGSNYAFLSHTITGISLVICSRYSGSPEASPAPVQIQAHIVKIGNNPSPSSQLRVPLSWFGSHDLDVRAL